MSGRAKNLVASIAAIFKSFIGVKKEDDVSKMGIKTSSAGIKWSLYYLIDWGIFAFYGFAVVMMKDYGFSFISIFLALWFLEVAIASAFLVFYKKTGKDITLGKNIRDAWSEMNRRSKIAGLIALSGLTLKLVFWDGSERAAMFFLKDTGLGIKAFVLLVAISATKMFAYTLLFSLGYNVFGKN